MKADFLYAGVHANIIIKKKKRQKKAHFLDKSVKIRGIKYINVENRLLFAPPPIKTPGYAPGYTHPQFWNLQAKTFAWNAEGLNSKSRANKQILG